MSWLEQWHQTEWPDLDVYLTSLTEQLDHVWQDPTVEKY